MMSANGQKGTAKVGSMIRPPGAMMKTANNKENDKTTHNKAPAGLATDTKVR
jgi:hypothetical protein